METREGRPFSTPDVATRIAAHALAENAVLVTTNEREFRWVEGLAVENWGVEMR